MMIMTDEKALRLAKEKQVEDDKKRAKAEYKLNQITSRDFYAGMALCGMLSHGNTRDRSERYLSEKSFKIAEAMMKERTKQ